MPNYVFAYHGGSMAETEAEQQAAFAAWGAFMGGLGDSIVDAGNPFGPSATVGADGVANGGTSNLSGYSIISAASLDEAAAKTKGCPVLSQGGSVEVHEIIPVM